MDCDAGIYSGHAFTRNLCFHIVHVMRLCVLHDRVL